MPSAPFFPSGERVTDNGSVWCFGDDKSGQLGNNSTVQSPAPVQVVGW